MKKIALAEEYDRKLERVAPPFLKGKRKTTQRIRWAIEELENRRIANKPVLQRKAG
jgi:hypothetical protein